MKKLLLALTIIGAPVFAGEIKITPETIEKIETAAQVAGGGLSGYGVWRGIKTWNDPMSRILYKRLVMEYEQYLTDCAPTISRFNRSGRIAYFKYAETARQLVVPLMLISAGVQLWAQATLAKHTKQVEREAREARLRKYFGDSDK